MARSCLPQEIPDYVVDLLRDNHRTLKSCCLVSKSWVPCARKHLFREVEFHTLYALKGWEKTFPDPTNSPAYYTRNLSIGCAQVLPTEVAGKSGWIQAFSRVVQLRVWVWVKDDPAWSVSRLFNLVCSLPLLENLDVSGNDIGNNDNDSAIIQPSTSPPLTGSLKLHLKRGVGSIIRRLLELPNRVRFRKLECSWYHEDDFLCTVAMVGECSDTLECVYIECAGLVNPRAGSLNLSKAIRLKEVVFQLELDDVWAAMALETLTLKHRDLQKVSIEIPMRLHYQGFLDNVLIGPPASARSLDLGSELARGTYQEWMDLDRALVQLWESNSIRTQIYNFAKGGEEAARACIGSLLPEMTKRGIVEMVDHTVF